MPEPKDRDDAREVPARRHASGWVVFQSGDEQTVDPNRAVDDERERRHEVIRGGSGKD